MPFIVSTLSSDQAYTAWNKPEVDSKSKVSRPAIKGGIILVKGKANITTKNLITPEGTLTSVTEEQLESLKTIKAFNDHLAGGHLKIINRESPVEKAVRDMKDRDESAPLNIEKGDFKPGGRAAGVAPTISQVE